MSKNSLGMKTTLVLCDFLKKKCYGLLELNIEQNFIKYDYLKEIKGYIDRNIYMDKNKIREQYKKIKEISFDEKEAEKEMRRMKEDKIRLQAEIGSLKENLLQRKKEANVDRKQQIEEELKVVREEEILLSRKVEELKNELEELE